MLEKLSLVADLQIKFHDLTILLKYEAWKVDVLQKGVFVVLHVLDPKHYCLYLHQATL